MSKYSILFYLAAGIIAGILMHMRWIRETDQQIPVISMSKQALEERPEGFTITFSMQPNKKAKP